MVEKKRNERDIEFANAGKAIDRTAERIRREVEALLAKLPLRHIAPDYVYEALGMEIIVQNT